MSFPYSPLSRSGSVSSVACHRVPFDTGSISVSAENYTGSYTWNIKKFSQIKERKILSAEFEVGNYCWRLLLFPKGNDNREKNKTSGVAVYLSFSHALFTPEFLNPRVKFQITAVNQKYPDRSISIGAQHTFSKRSPDWGFTHILLKEELQDPDCGFLVKDSLVFRAELTVVPRYMLRNETGFIGLSSREEAQGLNSVLQTLFHIPYFRKAIYSVNSAETVVTGTRLPHALRRLFFKLQYQDSTASTKEVVRILDHCNARRRFQGTMEKLALELMGSNVESVIPNLFQGRLCTYVENEGEEESERIESTYKQVDLNIAGCKNLYDALEKRCKVTKAAETKDAVQYTLFETLPSILYFQLHYTGEGSESKQGARTILNIADDLNMDYGGKRFFAPNSACSKMKNSYKLHSVFVQTITGEYFVYIKRQDTWFKFEDVQVQEVDEDEVLNSQRSSDEVIVYGLLYVRSSDRAQIMWETGKDDIVQSTRKELERSLVEKELHITERQTANTHIVINLATEMDIKAAGNSSSPMELVDFDYVKRYRLHRDSTFEELRNLVANDYKVSPSAQRYWLWRRGDTGHQTLDKIFPSLAQENKKLLSLHTIKDPERSADKRNNALMVVNLFLELPKPGESMLHEIQPGELLLFLKFYDPLKVTMDYVGSLYVSKKAYFGNVLDQAKELCNVHKDLEIAAARVATLEPSAVICDIFPQSTPHQNSLKSGDVVVIQPKMIALTAFLNQIARRSAFEDDSTLGKM